MPEPIQSSQPLYDQDKTRKQLEQFDDALPHGNRQETSSQPSRTEKLNDLFHRVMSLARRGRGEDRTPHKKIEMFEDAIPLITKDEQKQ